MGNAVGGRGAPRSAPPGHDTWVAACCPTHDVPLATLNLKDYDDFRRYHALSILGLD